MPWVNYKAEKWVLYVYVVSIAAYQDYQIMQTSITKSRNWIFTHVRLSAHAHNKCQLTGIGGVWLNRGEGLLAVYEIAWGRQGEADWSAELAPSISWLGYSFSSVEPFFELLPGLRLCGLVAPRTTSPTHPPIISCSTKLYNYCLVGPVHASMLRGLGWLTQS